MQNQLQQNMQEGLQITSASFQVLRKGGMLLLFNSIRLLFYFLKAILLQFLQTMPWPLSCGYVVKS